MLSAGVPVPRSRSESRTAGARTGARRTLAGAGGRLFGSRPLPGHVTDESLTGPWVLALGALAIGVGAVVVEALRRRGGDSREEYDEEPA